MKKFKYIFTFIGTAIATFGGVWTLIEVISFFGFNQLQNTGWKGIISMTSVSLHIASFVTFISYQLLENKERENPDSLGFVLKQAGVSGFYPDRDHYRKRGTTSESISGYINSATSSLIIVSISFITARDYEGTLDTIKHKLNNQGINFQVSISLLNPEKNYLLDSLSQNFGKDRSELRNDIRKGLNQLIQFRNGLSQNAKERFNIYLHNTIPFASAIIIDEFKTNAKIQLETKSYQAPYNKSLAIEVMPIQEKGSLFETLLISYKKLLEDADKV